MKKYTQDERSLIALLKTGDDSAFEYFYLTYHENLYAMALKWLKNHALAEDAVQNVYLSIWEYRKKLDCEGYYIYTAR